jgi:hypothetical protein
MIKNYQQTDIVIGLQNCNIDTQILEPVLRYHLAKTVNRNAKFFQI